MVLQGLKLSEIQLKNSNVQLYALSFRRFCVIRESFCIVIIIIIIIIDIIIIYMCLHLGDFRENSRIAKRGFIVLSLPWIRDTKQKLTVLLYWFSFRFLCH